MNRKIQVETTFQMLAGQLVLKTKPHLEVSLDCAVCQKRARTVVMGLSSQIRGEIAEYSAAPAAPKAAICTPTGHDFPARLVQHETITGTETVTLRYCFEYDYSAFNATAGSLRGDSSPLPRWARVSFLLRCPTCEVSMESSTQTNLGRPYDQGCHCGLPLLRSCSPPQIGLLS